MGTFNDGVTALLLSQPFYGSLLMRFRHVEDPRVGTMGVSKSTLYYAPDFVEKLTEDELIFVLSHEMHHAALGHVSQMEHYKVGGLGPDGKPFNLTKMNHAQDYIINDSVTKSKIGKMPERGLINPKFTCDMTPQEVYCLLPDPPPQGGGGGKGGKGDGPFDGKGHGGFDVHLDEMDADDAPAVTAADVVAAANYAKACRGDLPVGVDRLLGDIKKPRVSPWQQLRRWMVANVAGHDSTTWRRLNRRLVTRGIGAPGAVGTRCGRVGVVVDTSGSIGQDMLTLFGSHMAAILDEVKPTEICIYWVDAKVHRVDRVRSTSDLARLLQKPVPGGGGTDMPKGVDAAVEDKCEQVVVLTDGYTPFGRGWKTPVIWAITDPNKVASNGKTVHISE